MPMIPQRIPIMKPSAAPTAPINPMVKYNPDRPCDRKIHPRVVEMDWIRPNQQNMLKTGMTPAHLLPSNARMK